MPGNPMCQFLHSFEAMSPRGILYSMHRGGFHLMALALCLLCATRSGAGQRDMQLRDALHATPANAIQGLPLDPASRASLMSAVKNRNYAQGEKVLISAIQQNPKSPQLLTFLGGIYFLDHGCPNVELRFRCN
jgi:hypothetical protein